jgi:hypothetical protein
VRDRFAPLKASFSFILALAMAAPALGEGPVSPQAPDEGAYETDRPGEVDNPYTLGLGRAELVTYMEAMNAPAREDQFGDGGSAVVLDTSVRVGIASALEGIATVDTFLQAGPSDSNDGAARGFGFATLLAKWNFLRSPSSDYGVALAPFVRLPLNRRIAQDGRAALGLVVPFNVDLENGWELEGSLSAARTPREMRAWATTCEGQVSVQRALTSRLSSYLELQLESGDNLPAWGLEGGFNMRLSDAVLLDLGGSLGIGRNSRGRTVYVGLGCRI